MRIPQDVILIWTGLNSNIPSGWTRETSLDDKFPKAWGSQSPNVTGGALTHSHTTQPHYHSLARHTHTFQLIWQNVSGVQDENRAGGSSSTRPSEGYHTHNQATTPTNTSSNTSTDSFTTGTSSNLPPYYEVIFIKAGLSSLLQNGIIALWGDSNPPSDWQICDGNNGSPDLRNKYLKGATSGNNAGGTGGSYNNVHNLTHGHTGSSHNHGYATSGTVTGSNLRNTGSWIILETGHTHTFLTGTTTVSVNNFTGDYNTSETVEPNYKKVLALQFKTGAIKRKGIIGLWLGDVNNIPKGWVLCDGNNGTIDLRDKFIKIANTPGEVGTTGGSNTHTHANYSHYHTSPAHTHSIPQIDHYDGGASHLNADASGGVYDSLRTDIHIKHNDPATDSASPNWSSADIVFDPADNQPPYRTVAYIQFQKEIYGGGMLLNFL
jgi:hypothetical protein